MAVRWEPARVRALWRRSQSQRASAIELGLWRGSQGACSRPPAAQEQSCLSRIPSPSAFQRVAEAPSVQRFCVALLQDFLAVSDKTFGIVLVQAGTMDGTMLGRTPCAGRSVRLSETVGVVLAGFRL
jgi:hypothetical protein